MQNGHEEDAHGWFRASAYDLATAEAMRDAGRHLYVLFCCQQAVEKHLKGAVLLAAGRIPPRTHDLLRLAELSGREHPERWRRFLAELSAYYIGTRYPGGTWSSPAGIPGEVADSCLVRAKEYLEWLGPPRK